MAEVREALESDWRLERYENVEKEFAHSDGRDYPCVRVDSLTKDKMALTADGTRTTLLLQMAALYCLHPDPSYAGTAFAIVYSHRGPSLHPGFGEEARDFIDGVRVPANRN